MYDLFVLPSIYWKYLLRLFTLAFPSNLKLDIHHDVFLDMERAKKHSRIEQKMAYVIETFVLVTTWLQSIFRLFALVLTHEMY